MHKVVKSTMYIITSILIAVNIVLIPSKGDEITHRLDNTELADCKVPIILYHNILQSIDNTNVLVNITPENLKDQLAAIKEAGFEAIDFDDYCNYTKGKQVLPKKPIIITFDDGYLSNYQYAFPILKELNMKATIFIVTETVGAVENVSYPHFTWLQAKEMEESGLIDIESHSHTHREFTSLNINEMVREVRLSKYLIETRLNKECNYFAFPFGAYNEQSISLASKAGYKMLSLLGNYGYNTKNTPPSMLRRITVEGDKSGQEIVSMIEKNLEIPYTDSN